MSWETRLIDILDKILCALRRPLCWIGKHEWSNRPVGERWCWYCGKKEEG